MEFYIYLYMILGGKRLVIVYIIIFFWIIFGGLALIFDTDFYDLSLFFLSLTGFVGTYIFSETVRSSSSPSIFSKGKYFSSREKIIYTTMLLWFIIGVLAIVFHKDLIPISAYFGALTPFVSAVILGQTFKQDDINNQVGIGSMKINKDGTLKSDAPKEEIGGGFGHGHGHDYNNQPLETEFCEYCGNIKNECNCK